MLCFFICQMANTGRLNIERLNFKIMPEMSDICQIYKDPSKSTFITSVVLAAGIVLSYAPQYYNIVKTRTSLGLAPTFLLLISVAGISATSNLILLSFISIPCCSELTGFECINSQISLIQVGLQCISTLLITLFCVKLTTPSEDNVDRDEIILTWRYIQAWIVFMFLTLTISYFWLSDSSLLVYAQLLGVLSTAITVIQYIPQLWTTYCLKRSGVLSVLMMCIQTPGGFIWTATLMLKPGAHWSSWLPYLTAAVFQGLLLIISVYYDHIYKGEKPLLGQSHLPTSYGSDL